MAIEFVVEDGTGKSDATSYLSVSDFRQYHENRGTDYSSETETDIQSVLNIATEYVDNLYPYKGQAQYSEQALEFPRSYLLDRRLRDLADEVPQEVQDATAIAAGYELDGNSLADLDEEVSSRSMGPVSVTYKGRGKRPQVSKRVERLLGDFIAQVQVTR